MTHIQSCVVRGKYFEVPKSSCKIFINTFKVGGDNNCILARLAPDAKL